MTKVITAVQLAKKLKITPKRCRSIMRSLEADLGHTKGEPWQLDAASAAKVVAHVQGARKVRKQPRVSS